LYKKEIELADVNFIDSSYSDVLKNNSIRVFARVRYRQPLTSATLEASHESSVISYKLIFESPQKFVAVGQSAVWYSAEGQMLGGGVIIGAK
ncbi:MAG: hypothetical protein Q7R94_01935, partial [bacterium]|nr:hypothetical protein [bacterium]